MQHAEVKQADAVHSNRTRLQTNVAANVRGLVRPQQHIRSATIMRLQIMTTIPLCASREAGVGQRRPLMTMMHF